MQRHKAPPFSADDKVFLRTLRDDISARPEFYLLGLDYLQLRHSVDSLYAADLEVWERMRQIDPSRIKPDHASDDYCLSRRLIRVFEELLNEGLSTPDRQHCAPGSSKGRSQRRKAGDGEDAELLWGKAR